jgi:hypothetical protein
LFLGCGAANWTDGGMNLTAIASLGALRRRAAGGTA